MTKETPTKPEDRITVVVNGEDRELFMSSGLIRKIVTHIGELNDISDIYIYPEIQDKAMLEILAERNERGKPVIPLEDMDMMAYNISTEDGDKIVQWMGAHSLYFFINGANSLKKEMKAQEAPLKNLEQSLAGSKN